MKLPIKVLKYLLPTPSWYPLIKGGWGGRTFRQLSLFWGGMTCFARKGDKP